MSHEQLHSKQSRKKFKQLTDSDRHTIQSMLKLKLTNSKIAKALGVHPSTISRELRRGAVSHMNTHLIPYITYSADRSIEQHRLNVSARGPSLKIAHNHALSHCLHSLITKKKYSPYAALSYCITNSSKIGITVNICLKTLYNYINNHGFPIKADFLPQGKKKRRKPPLLKRNSFKRTKSKSIDQRPEEVNNRVEFGHHEMDTVVSSPGAKGCLLVITERLTRFEHIIKLEDKTQYAVRKALNKLEAHYGKEFPFLFRSFTCDNGSEFLDDEAICTSRYSRSKHRCDLYYAHPYCSSERGSNENNNRLIRRFIPKGFDISSIPQDIIHSLARWMNHYPRHIFKGLSSSDKTSLFTFHNKTFA